MEIYIYIYLALQPGINLTDQGPFQDCCVRFHLVPGHSKTFSPVVKIPIFHSHFFLFFWLHRAACGILVPRPGIESAES